MKKLLLSLLMLLVLAGFVSATASFTTNFDSGLTLSGQENLALNRNVIITNTGDEVINFNALSTNGTFTDSQGDRITFTFNPSTTFSVPNTTNNQQTVTLTANIADNVRVGTYTGTLLVSGTGQTSAQTPSRTIPLTVRVDPKICKDGRVSNGNAINDVTSGDLIVDINEPDDGDNFGPGDEIDLDVNVENNADNDLDVVVEAILYNIDQNSEIASVESEQANINDGNDDDFAFSLKVPTSDSDLDENDDFVLFIKVMEDGNEDEYCNYDALDMDFERDSDDVAVNSVVISPSVAMCTDTVNVAVEVQNVGTDNQETVQVRVKETTLGMDLSSEIFSLDEFDDSGDRALQTFTFDIPSNAEPGDYFVDTRVYFVGKSSESVLTKLTVSECESPVSQDVLSLAQTSFTATQGNVFTVPLTLKNSGSRTATYTVDVQADWADVSTEQTVSVAAGQQTTVYAYLTPKPSLTSGVYSGTVSVEQNGRVVKTSQFTTSVGSQGPTGGTTFQPSITASSVWRNLSQSTAFWIAAVVIVFTLVVYVLSALLRPK